MFINLLIFLLFFICLLNHTQEATENQQLERKGTFNRCNKKVGNTKIRTHSLAEIQEYVQIQRYSFEKAKYRKVSPLSLQQIQYL